MTDAHIPKADLNDANLRGVLHVANLTHAYLIDADLSNADLFGANLRAPTWPALT